MKIWCSFFLFMFGLVVIVCRFVVSIWFSSEFLVRWLIMLGVGICWLVMFSILLSSFDGVMWFVCRLEKCLIIKVRVMIE